MNKILFHEGGQPLYLDDLALLQANVLENQRALLSAFTGSQVRACFVNKPSFVGVRGDDGITFRIPAGRIIVDGDVIAYGDTELKTQHENATLYIGITRRDTDIRTFEDGQLRPCRQEVTTTWTHSPEGFDEVFKYADLPSLTAIVTHTQGGGTATADADGYRNVPVFWWHNITGSVRMRSADNQVRVRVEARAYNGLLPATSNELFSFEDPADTTQLDGYVTNHFTLNGQEYAFVFQQRAASLVKVEYQLHTAGNYYVRLNGSENLPPDLLQELTLRAKVKWNSSMDKYITDNQ